MIIVFPLRPTSCVTFDALFDFGKFESNYKCQHQEVPSTVDRLSAGDFFTADHVEA
jgi:hypothetical protein